MAEETDPVTIFAAREFSVQGRLTAHMDAALEQINAGRVIGGLGRLQVVLSERRRTLPEADWSRFVQTEVLTHGVREIVHADPFTYRAFSKPRGYAGDAVMMDYIYGYREKELRLLPDPVGRVFDYCTGTAAPQAVRFRRQVVAENIDAAAARGTRPIEVVALAAGHLREVDLSLAARTGGAAITAIDQDEASLSQINEDYSQYGVKTIAASVRDVLAGRRRLPESDLSYTSGLYDYLPDSAATRLTTVMFEAVRPGGTLLLANFLPNILDAGYMESLMDWHLIYRGDDQMRALAGGVPPGDLAAVEQFHDPFDNITFLRLTKAG